MRAGGSHHNHSDPRATTGAERRPRRPVGDNEGNMKLTRASSYALHAVVYLAHEQSEKPVASHLIAQAQGIPERFLLKVLKPLVSARMLDSVKGPHGGYKLRKQPSDISV